MSSGWQLVTGAAPDEPGGPKEGITESYRENSDGAIEKVTIQQFVGDKSIMLPNTNDWKNPEVLEELRAPVLIAYNVEMGEDGNPECVWLDYHINPTLLKDAEAYMVIQKMKKIEGDLCRYYPRAKCWLIAKPGGDRG